MASQDLHIPTLLRDIYYDPKGEAGFSSVDRVLKEARKRLPEVTRADVADYLASQFPYNLHRRRLLKYKRNHILTSGPEELVQGDLIDTRNLKETNDGYSYILTLIDVFTKRAFAYPLKTKAALHVESALKHMFDNYFVPQYFQTDAGTEFINQKVQALLKQYHVNYYTARNEVIKCAVVERFQRTLQSKLHKYFTSTNNTRYIDVLHEFMSGYNNRVHRSIGMAPNAVTANNTRTVFQRLYGATSLRDYVKRHKRSGQLAVGNVVRVARQKQSFRKGYVPTFSDELYVITEVSPSTKGSSELYSLKSKAGRHLRGRYYRQELCRVSPSVESYYRLEPDFIKTYAGRQREA